MSDKVNFNLYNLSGNMLSFLREEELTEEQQNDILGVLGLTTEGLQGPPGPDGLSAYQVAVDNGFSGDETAWLSSLVGPQGSQGPAGQDSSELYKPYLYNDYLAYDLILNYWQYEGWNGIFGPLAPGFENTIFPDGLEYIQMQSGFTIALTQDDYGYDPLPFSIRTITTSLTAPLDSTGINAVINTIGNCDKIIQYPHPYTRTLDLSLATYDGGAQSFFDPGTQSIIEIMLSTGWVILWPYDGVVSDPYIAIDTWPNITSAPGGFYFSQLDNVLYSSVTLPADISEMSIVSDVGVFPYRKDLTSLNEIYVTSNSTIEGIQYYYYSVFSV